MKREKIISFDSVENQLPPQTPIKKSKGSISANYLSTPRHRKSSDFDANNLNES